MLHGPVFVQVVSPSFRWFPFLYFLCFRLFRDEAYLFVTPLNGYFCDFFHWSLLLAFSLHFSSSSAFLKSLVIQSFHSSCDLLRYLQPSCFFVSDIFGNLSCFILPMCPAHLIRLLTILPNIQALVPTSSRRYFILLSTLFTPAILLIQLFAHTCSLYCCSSGRANVSKQYVLADTIQESTTFPVSLMEIVLSIMTPFHFSMHSLLLVFGVTPPLARSQIYIHPDTQHYLLA